MHESDQIDLVTHTGGCHCGRVEFEFDAPAEATLSDCNCSVCRMTGYLHLIVPKDAFRLTKGDESLTRYEFNTGAAKHFFCSRCGIKSFYVPRSHPDGISINGRCIRPGTFSPTAIKPFDGQNWEQNVHLLHQQSG